MKIDEIEYKGLKFKYRHSTTDWGIIQEACGGLNTRWFDVEPGELWFDIGAHIGAFTCYAASKQAIVSAFEPLPENFTLLQDNVVLNNLESYVKTHNLAVTDRLEKLEFHVDTMNYGNCSKYERGLTTVITVDTIPASSINIFDDICLKIDTEGCEYSILSSIDLTKVRKLILELHYWLIPEYEKVEIINMLHSYFPYKEEHGGYMHYAWR